MHGCAAALKAALLLCLTRVVCEHGRWIAEKQKQHEEDTRRVLARGDSRRSRASETAIDIDPLLSCVLLPCGALHPCSVSAEVQVLCRESIMQDGHASLSTTVLQMRIGLMLHPLGQTSILHHPSDTIPASGDLCEVRQVTKLASIP